MFAMPTHARAPGSFMFALPTHARALGSFMFALPTNARARTSGTRLGRTALMIAVEKVDSTSVQMLLQAGADTTLRDMVS